MTDPFEKGVHAATERLGSGWQMAVVLGSGLGAVAASVEDAVELEYSAVAGMPHGSVPGHAAKIVAGTLGGWRTLLFCGRFHLYEGHDAFSVTSPVRLAHALGCRNLLLTNAVGGIDPTFLPGDFMYVSDHINLLGENPLRGISPPPFIDLCSLYRQDLYPMLARFAQSEKIPLHQGVLAALMGPSYETPAEIRALRTLGADAVSMSTVPEAIMGKYLGMEVAALSLVSNPAAGLASAPLDHSDVLERGRRAEGHFISLLNRLLQLWHHGEPLSSPATSLPSEPFEKTTE